MQQEPSIIYEVADRVATITLNRPEKRNALNFTMVTDLNAAMKRAEEDEAVKVIVLKGNGKAFCAGADLDYLKRLQSFSLEENLQDSNQLKDMFLSIYRNKKVVIAQVQGHAIAGGCGLVTVCDFAFSVPEAKYGYSEVKIGFIPAVVMTFLIRKAGETRAKELLLSGKVINAEIAERYNLINEILPADEIEAHVAEFAQTLCTQNSLQSMEITKKMIGDVQVLPIESALEFTAKMNAHARGTEDCKKGISSFLNKEKLEW